MSSLVEGRATCSTRNLAVSTDSVGLVFLYYEPRTCEQQVPRLANEYSETQVRNGEDCAWRAASPPVRSTSTNGFDSEAPAGQKTRASIGPRHPAPQAPPGGCRLRTVISATRVTYQSDNQLPASVTQGGPW
jgi:hypothetical protein